MTLSRAAPALSNPQAVEMTDDLSIVYPCTDDMPMADNDVQFIPVTDALAALRHQFIHRDDVYVSGNLFIYYRMNDNNTWVAPDVFVVMGGTRKGPRHSWITWREGKVPDFALEITSPSTWQNDAVGKRRIYANMGVTEYWRFDPLSRYFNPPLVGERLVDGEYRPIEVTMDADGILRGHSPVLGLDLCVLPGGLLRFYDPERGQWLNTYEEEVAIREAEARARETAERSLQDEATARQAAEAARQESETARQEAETARQAAEAARQAAEAALQQETAARQSLEDEIRRLRQQLPPGE